MVIMNIAERHCNKSWFNSECESKRKEYLQIKNKIRRARTQEERLVLEVEYKRKFSKYKKFIKKVQREYSRNLQKRIRDVKSSDPKAFWNLLNKADGHVVDFGGISPENFREHFKNLSFSPNIDGNNDLFDPITVSHSTNKFINEPFSLDEIGLVVRKLKSNKACGLWY